MSDAGAEALDRWQNSGDAADDALSRAAESADRATQSVSSAASVAGNASDRLGSLGDEAAEAADRMNRLDGELGGAGDSMDDLSDRATAAEGRLEDLGDAAEDAGDQSEEFGQRSSKAVQSLASVLTSAGVVMLVKEIGGAFMEASEAAAEYETALAKVSTIADPTAASMSEISADITELSMDMGQAVGGLSEATYQAISASVDTANSVEFVGTATKLAAGGFTESATAVDVLTTAINSYNLEASDATNISDVLITTQNLGKTSVDQLATNMGRVIPLASAYNVEIDNLSSAYAVMTANGVATAESTTYIKSMLSELGNTSSTVSKVLMEETGMTFADLSASGYSLGDVLEVLGDSVNGNATAFNGLWGSVEAGVGALSLYNAGAERYNDVLGEMQDSAGATAAAYEAMTDTTEHASQRMSNSFDNLQISVGTAVNPAFEIFYNLVADGVDAMTRFTNAHPALVAGITAAVAVFGVATVGLAAYSAITAAASAVTAAFGTTVAAVFWPVTAAVAAVAALAAVGATLISAIKAENEEFNALDATSKQHSETLDDLNAQYEEAVRVYGENSEQAQALAQDIAGLEAQYEATSSTIEEFIAKNDALIKSHDEAVSKYTEASAQLETEEKSTTALIGKLEQLTSKTSLSVGEHEQMSAIISKLNQDLPGLSLAYDEVTGSLNMSSAAMKAMAEAEAQERRQQADYEAYVALLADQADLEEQLAKAKEQTAAAQERCDNASGWDQFWDVGQVTSDLEDFTAEQERLQAALDETNDLIEEHEEAWEDAQDAIENSTVDYETAVATAVSSVKEELDTLAQQYDDAWTAARDSIDGQIGLFDEMATETESSIADMTAAMQSQVEYLTTYSENLAKAAEYGLDQGLIQSLSDGSSESAGYIDAIISEIDRLGGTTEEAAAFVSSFNTQFQQVEEAKDGFATTVATMETDFDGAMTDIESRLDTAIGNMNMDTEAAEAAQATIDAYVASIRSGVAEAQTAASAVASATQAALTSSYSTVTGYATGTTYAEPGVHIVGEEGPEAIFFKGGETVLNANDTQQYLASQRPLQTSVPDGVEYSEGAGERRIVLEIAGRGSLELSGSNYDEDAIAEWMADNLRPMLVKTLKQEIFEEGDGSHDF